MAITKKAPNKIHLSGPIEVSQKDDATGVGTYQATESITPGHLVEAVLNGTELNIRKNAVAGEVTQALVALNQPELNEGIDDAYAAGETVKTGLMQTGCVIYGLIASGQNISAGDYMDSAGDGTWKENASGAKSYISLDSPGAVTVSTRLRVKRIK